MDDLCCNKPVAIRSFRSISESELYKIVAHSKPSTCDLDPVPNTFWKNYFKSVSTTALKIVNKIDNNLWRLESSPSLKKSNLDSCVLSNNVPITNLPFMSKILENVVFHELAIFLNENSTIPVKSKSSCQVFDLMTTQKQLKDTLPIPQKSCTIAFCFDYWAHLLWHCFDNLMQCHNIYFHPELHSFLVQILYWWLESLTIFSFNAKYFQCQDLALLSWNISEEKIHWWDNLVIRYIQERWLAVPRTNQLKQPQIITLQFADSNRNDDLMMSYPFHYLLEMFSYFVYFLVIWW